MRRRIVAGNWKLQGDRAFARTLLDAVVAAPAPTRGGPNPLQRRPLRPRCFPLGPVTWARAPAIPAGALGSRENGLASAFESRS